MYLYTTTVFTVARQILGTTGGGRVPLPPGRSNGGGGGGRDGCTITMPRLGGK